MGVFISYETDKEIQSGIHIQRKDLAPLIKLLANEWINTTNVSN